MITFFYSVLDGKLGCEGTWASGTEPFTFGHQVHVGAGEDVLFHLEVKLVRSGLIGADRVAQRSAVLEFAEHELLIAHENGTGGIAIVQGSLISQTQLLEDVIYDDGGR